MKCRDSSGLTSRGRGCGVRISEFPCIRLMSLAIKGNEERYSLAT